jgi:Contractile injection system tape measure protein
LGIAANDKVIAPDRALGLLHFLATGQPAAPEYELLLPKILCNVPLDVPANAPAELTAAEREEAEALLAAVIGHWTALGDTSVDGLRGSFLARPGKLSRRGAEDLLQVEQRSYDILLDRLPWGIGMVQLPWMEKILRVEWRF